MNGFYSTRQANAKSRDSARWFADTLHSGHTRLQSEAYASTTKSTHEPFTINCHNTVCILAVPWLPLLEAGPEINVSRGGEATMPLAQVECADRHSRTRTF